MRKWTGGVGSGSHDGECRAKRKSLRDDIAAGPSTVTKRLQNRMCRRLSEVQLADDVGEAQPRIPRPGQELDNVDYPGGRR